MVPTRVWDVLRSSARLLVRCWLPALVLTGCAGTSAGPATPAAPGTPQERIRAEYGTIHGQDGFTLFGGDRKPDANGGGGGGGGGGIGVNVYLWRAALETIDFMPLVQADPFGGVIITDWYSPSETTSERFKLTVYILDRSLRADAIKVAVFRQTSDGGSWVDARVDPETKTGIENSILTRARELRIAALGTAEG
jgi:uncharacterized protein DUF3576